MSTLSETTALLHRALPPLGGLEEEDVLRALSWTEDLLRRCERLHRRGELHGGVCPAAVRVGPRGADLSPPGVGTPAPEFRDPERTRSAMRDDSSGRGAEPRHDLYGIGATLFSVLDGGPPTCGPRSRFTRPVPSAVAYVTLRAMAEGAARYPTASSMLEDVARLRRLAGRPGGVAAVRPEELGSYSGPIAAEPRRLVPFEVRRRRGRAAMGAFVVTVLAVSGIAWALRLSGGGEAPAAAAAPKPPRSGLLGLLDGWRGRLADRLGAMGETLDPTGVPLLVVSDVPIPRDPGWAIHPSESLRAAVAAVLADDVDPRAVQEALLDRIGEDTLPAVLWVSRGRARLYYRGIVWEGLYGVEPAGSPRRSRSDRDPM